MVRLRSYLSSPFSCRYLIFLVFSYFLLDYRGEAIRWFSGACPAPVTLVADWIKSASFFMMEGVDADGYTHLVWFWCLGLAWLERQVFWDFFPHKQFFLELTGSAENIAEFDGQNWVEWLSIMEYISMILRL